MDKLKGLCPEVQDTSIKGIPEDDPFEGSLLSLGFDDLGHQLDSFNDMSLVDQGILTIETILAPGSKSLKGLSEDQIKGLESLQACLAGGLQEDAFVPQSLLRERNLDSSSYLIQNFGGMKSNHKQRLKTFVKANFFVKGLIEKSNSKRTNIAVSAGRQPKLPFYAPPEFSRCSKEQQLRLRNMLTWDSITSWDFPIFELAEISNGKPLLFLGWAILGSPRAQHVMDLTCEIETNDLELSDREGYNFVDEFNLEMAQVTNFIRLIEKSYIDNPYHNKTHAADVLQTLHALLQMNGKEFATGQVQLFSILISAVVHDVAHPGKNNTFQVNAKTDLTVTYNDRSVLENLHASKTFDILLNAEQYKETAGDIDILSGLTKEESLSVRKNVIGSVLHTDMTKHFKTLSYIKGLGTDPKTLTEEKRWHVLSFLLHCADISNPTKPCPRFIQWADLCLEEFFAQGDLEKEKGLPVSPLCDRLTNSRADSQIGFTTFIILPTFEVVGKLIPRVQEEVFPVIKDNLMHWKREKEMEEK